MARNSNRNADDRTDAAGTVSVACRLPAGLIVDVVVDGNPVRLAFKGANDPRALALADEQGFHGITSGVPAAHWKAVEEQYADAKWLASGALFAAGKVKAVESEAQAIGAVDLGYNPIDPAVGPIAGVTPGDDK